MRVGEVATRAGVHRETLRYYERRGLIARPPRAPSGYRQYPADTVERVRFIKWAQGLGFTLRELLELSRIPRDHVRGRTRHVRARAATKITEIDEQIGRLIAMTGSVPLSCNLAGFDRVQSLRYQELRKAMKASELARQPLPDGYGASFTPDPVVFTQLAEWITLERVCCPFLAFALEWSESAGLRLRLTGGPDVRRFLHEQLNRPA